MIRKEIGTPCFSATLKTRARRGVYAINFFYALHVGVIVYFQSSFLVREGFSDDTIGLFYALGSVAIILGLFVMPRILARIGNFPFLVALVLIEFLALLGLGMSNTTLVIASLFLLTNTVGTLIGMPLDIFLEETTESEAKTGGTRGIFLTMYNIAFVLAPASAGYIVGLTAEGASLGILFIISAFVITPVIPLAFFYLKPVPDRIYQPLHIRAFVETLKLNLELRLAFWTQFVLRMFFAVMVVYTPLYLHQVAGLSFATIGLLSSMMLLAYLILELPLGHIVEKYSGEKIIMAGGFIIAALATAAIPFVPLTASVALWGIVLFATRVGGAMVDITSEIFFFRQVDGDDTDDVSVFRTLGPLAYIAGPLIGSLTIAVFGLPYIFIVCTAILLMGVPLALRIPPKSF